MIRAFAAPIRILIASLSLFLASILMAGGEAKDRDPRWEGKPLWSSTGDAGLIGLIPPPLLLIHEGAPDFSKVRALSRAAVAEGIGVSQNRTAGLTTPTGWEFREEGPCLRVTGPLSPEALAWLKGKVGPVSSDRFELRKLVVENADLESFTLSLNQIDLRGDAVGLVKEDHKSGKRVRYEARDVSVFEDERPFEFPGGTLADFLGAVRARVAPRYMIVMLSRTDQGPALDIYLRMQPPDDPSLRNPWGLPDTPENRELRDRSPLAAPLTRTTAAAAKRAAQAPEFSEGGYRYEPPAKAESAAETSGETR